MTNWLDHTKEFRYMMLNRLREDCDYYLSYYGNRSYKCLWAEDEELQIQKMKDIWNTLSSDEIPDWLSWEDILEYEKQMCCVKK